MKNSGEDEVFVSYPIPSFFRPKRFKYRSLMVMQCRRRVLLQGLLSDHVYWIEELGRKLRCVGPRCRPRGHLIVSE